MTRLQNRTALVTGASRGIGRAIAQSLSAEGAHVILVARSRDGLEETKRLSSDPNAEVFCVDLRDGDAIEHLANAAQNRGPVDILVNAAGAWHDDAGKYHGPSLDRTPAGQIDEVLGVGIRASMLVTRALLPAMIARRKGKILQLACGFAGPHEARGWLHYYVTNKAIEAFTAGLASELRPHEIQVNCIAPWYVASEAMLRFFPEELESALDMTEVARLATFLVSAESDNISGQVIEMRCKADHK